ncbi:Isochorismatase hydrolase [Karstenula rhodostoma CBS 690.94]|uniref:Isochorismatase hydrolase n=1 Tax=Karstenula rhodostoma CBS 690.94 TaxID=1392251 RepID=A0A9P4PQ71_9PLEO|nr:Isochorismatase hydrolase [Karstenula rhodostoma CBS 690.94]
MSLVNDPHSQIFVGSSDNFWLWNHDSGWDLTHPPSPTAPPVQPRLSLECHVGNVTLDPAKTALIIIDMQNFSLCSALGDVAPSVLSAEDKLLQHGIPAARKAEIQIVWLNWGLDEEDLSRLPPSTIRAFGWDTECTSVDYDLFRSPSHGNEVTKRRAEMPTGRHPGSELGIVTLPNGTEIDAGRVLMKGSWNSDLHLPLSSAFSEGQIAARPDVIIHKNRNSGLYSSKCSLTRFLEREGIRILLFAGINTDQCVMGTLQDAHARGFDTILLRDGCATDSPIYTQQNAEWNCCMAWGFLSSC